MKLCSPLFSVNFYYIYYTWIRFTKNFKWVNKDLTASALEMYYLYLLNSYTPYFTLFILYVKYICNVSQKYTPLSVLNIENG